MPFLLTLNMHYLLNFHAVESSFINPNSIVWVLFLEEKQLKQKFQAKAKANLLIPISVMLFQIIYEIAKIFKSMFMSMFKSDQILFRSSLLKKHFVGIYYLFIADLLLTSIHQSLSIFIHPSVHSSIYPSIYSSIHSFFYSFILSHLYMKSNKKIEFQSILLTKILLLFHKFVL